MNLSDIQFHGIGVGKKAIISRKIRFDGELAAGAYWEPEEGEPGLFTTVAGATTLAAQQRCSTATWDYLEGSTYSPSIGIKGMWRFYNGSGGVQSGKVFEIILPGIEEFTILFNNSIASQAFVEFDLPGFYTVTGQVVHAAYYRFDASTWCQRATGVSPGFYIVPYPDEIITNNIFRIQNLHATSSKILSVLYCG